MKPWETLATAEAPGVGTLTLARRGDEYVLRVRGHTLMSSRQHGSEAAMAEAGCAALATKAGARVLVGGLGFGFTVRAALELLRPDAKVTVAELLAPVIEWNRGLVSSLAGAPLEDPRVDVVEGDVRRVMTRSGSTFDAILLDVDNGPAPLTRADNVSLYDETGLAIAYGALRPGGKLVVWSAGEDPRFVSRMEKSGFAVQVLRPAAHGTKGTRHTLFVGTRRK
jgi:spermidine synthase